MTAAPLRVPQPDPVVASVAVEVDAVEQTVTVWPVETRSQAGRVWGDALEELAEAEATGDWDWASPVWAYAGSRRVARGVPDADGALCFRFSHGDPVYRELTTTPRLSAVVVVDRARACIMYVRFHGRRR
jgi:hypothetical protein